jgi:hypothetical protein
MNKIISKVVWLVLRKTHLIGVYDYQSLVDCLEANYKLVFVDPPRDPQDMIQKMAAEIQNLRRRIQEYQDNI